MKNIFKNGNKGTRKNPLESNFKAGTKPHSYTPQLLAVGKTLKVMCASRHCWGEHSHAPGTRTCSAEAVREVRPTHSVQLPVVWLGM